MKKFKKLFIPADFPMARVFNTAQDHVESVITPVLNSVIIDGVHIKEVDLTASADNVVEHKLNRKPLGL